jgi:hypothetical protein
MHGEKTLNTMMFIAGLLGYVGAELVEYATIKIANSFKAVRK